MFLLSKLLPRGLGKKSRDKSKGVQSEADMLCLGDKQRIEYNCKVLLLDDTELALNVKVCTDVYYQQLLLSFSLSVEYL